MKIVQYMLGIRNADGGVVRAVVDLCALLASAGDEVIALTVDDRDAPRDWNGRDGKPLLHTLNASRMLPMLLNRASLARAAQFFKSAGAVHLHVPWDPICAQLARLALRMKIPYFITVHGMLDDWTLAQKAAKKKAYLAMFGRRLLENAAAVQCTSQFEMEQSSKRYPRGRSAVVPLPFDLEPFRNLPGPEQARQLWPQRPDAFTALAVGRVHPIKRLELLIEAAAILKRRNERVDIVIAGAGEPDYEQTLHALAEKQGVRERVHLVGFISGSAKLSLYQVVDVVVHPSAHENFGYATVEGLACSTPVITTKAVNIWPELALSGGAKIVQQNAEAFADGLGDLQADRPALLRMGENARQWALQQFDANRILGLYRAMYNGEQLTPAF